MCATASMHACVCISRVPNQNGVSLLYIMLEIHHSGMELSIYVFKSACTTASMCVCGCVNLCVRVHIHV